MTFKQIGMKKETTQPESEKIYFYKRGVIIMKIKTYFKRIDIPYTH